MSDGLGSLSKHRQLELASDLQLTTGWLFSLYQGSFCCFCSSLCPALESSLPLHALQLPAQVRAGPPLVHQQKLTAKAVLVA